MHYLLVYDAVNSFGENAIMKNTETLLDAFMGSGLETNIELSRPTCCCLAPECRTS
jgi:hypothetical protein